MADPVRETIEGDGYAVTHLDALGAGPGFRKIRKEVGVTAFGINAVVLPPGYHQPGHYHERQEEAYFVHQGTVQFEFGDGSTQVLDAGGIARVDPSTVRGFRNVGDGEAVYIAVGGADGYVGRDGKVPE
jgi:quercetin dioxygenase-like cupin family protein